MASKSPPSPTATTTTTPSSPTTTTTINFGNPSSLPQIHSLTDLNTITRLLHECIHYQRSLDLSLTSHLSTLSSLDTHLSSLLSAAGVLSIIQSDAAHILSSVSTTSSLADTVISKVRQLDLAQSRVTATLSRLDAINVKSHCIESVRAAIEGGDFEAGAGFVKKFLEVDEGFGGGGGDGEGYGEEVNQREEMRGYKKQLEGIVKKKLASAVDSRDHGMVVRFVKLYPLLGIEDEGLQVNGFPFVLSFGRMHAALPILFEISEVMPYWVGDVFIN